MDSKRDSFSLAHYGMLSIAGFSFVALCFSPELLKAFLEPVEFDITFAIWLALAALFPVLAIQAIWLLRQPFANPVSATLFCLAAVHVAFVLMPHYLIQIQFESPQQIWLYGFFVGGIVGGVVSTLFIRRFLPSVFGSRDSFSGTNSQFRIQNLFVWMTMAGIILACAPQIFESRLGKLDGLFRVIWFAGIFAIGNIVLLPLLILIHRVGPMWLTGLTLTTFSFVFLLAGFCIHELSYDSYTDTTDEIRYFTLAFSASFLMAVYTVWNFALRLANDWKLRPISIGWKWVSNSMWCIKVACFAAAVGMGLYMLLWLVLHFGLTGLPSRDVELLRHSKWARQQLESVYPSETVAAVREKVKTDDLLDIFNELNRHSVTQDQDACYQIAKTSLINNFDNSVLQEARFVMGFTADEISLLPDHQFERWLDELRPNRDGQFGGIDSTWNDSITNESPQQVLDIFSKRGSNTHIMFSMLFSSWKPGESPWASQYCAAKQSVFQSIREASQCKRFCEVVHPLGLSPDVSTYAREMLTIDGNYQVGLGNLDLAIENCESLMRLSALMAQTSAHWSNADAEYRYRTYAAEVAWRILYHPNCSSEQAGRIHRLFRDQPELFSNYESRSIKCFVANLVGYYFGHANYLKDYPQLAGANVKTFAVYHPRSIDWEYAVTATYRQAEKQIQWSRDSDTFRKLYQPIQQNIQMEIDREEWQDSFQYETIVMLGSPRSKANSLVDHNAIYFALHPKTGFSCHRRNRMDRIAISIRYFQILNGRLPNSLDEMVPEIVGEIPLDPVTEQPFQYRVEADEFILYSLGKDLVDDGGDETTDRVWDRPMLTLIEYLDQF